MSTALTNISGLFSFVMSFILANLAADGQISWWLFLGVLAWGLFLGLTAFHAGWEARAERRRR